MGVSFISTVGLADEGPFTTFKDALDNFIKRMKALIEGCTALSVIEQACWIERESNGARIPLGFYDARDFGFKVGLLNDESVFQPDVAEPDQILVSDVYTAVVAVGSAGLFIENLPPTSKVSPELVT